MNIPEKFWKMGVILLGILSAFIVVLGIKELSAIKYLGTNPTSNVITVEGTGDAVAVPDIATFSFSVSETAKTVAEAQAKATTKINKALAAVKAAGVADKDVKTQGYNINPHYEYQNSVCPAASTGIIYCPPGRSTLTGYDVSQTIEVKIRDLSKAGEIFTVVGALEVENVNSLNFSIDDPDKIQAEARAEAIDKAEAKAKELARELGVRLVRIVSFSENGSGYPYPIYGRVANMAMDASKGEATPPQVPAGEQKITSSVSITYEIK